jgi:hypothetical protein
LCRTFSRRGTASFTLAGSLNISRGEWSLEESSTRTTGKILTPILCLAGAEKVPANIAAVVVLDDLTTRIGEGDGMSILLAGTSIRVRAGGTVGLLGDVRAEERPGPAVRDDSRFYFS